jgi:hypothetical protein
MPQARSISQPAAHPDTTGLRLTLRATPCLMGLGSLTLLLAVFGCGAPSDEVAGATYCESSSDGSAVTCGSRATYCESSSDGSAVACGEEATYCESSTDGSAVACGGKATYCESSTDGSAEACGGEAKG